MAAMSDTARRRNALAPGETGDPSAAPTLTHPAAAPVATAAAMSDPLSPAAALRLEEVERSQVFFQVVIALAIGGAISALASAGDATTKLVLLVTSALSASSAVFARAVLLDPATYH